jgi:hypothetical protein
MRLLRTIRRQILFLHAMLSRSNCSKQIHQLPCRSNPQLSSLSPKLDKHRSLEVVADASQSAAPRFPSFLVVERLQRHEFHHFILTHQSLFTFTTCTSTRYGIPSSEGSVHEPRTPHCSKSNSALSAVLHQSPSTSLCTPQLATPTGTSGSFIHPVENTAPAADSYKARSSESRAGRSLQVFMHVQLQLLDPRTDHLSGPSLW